MSKNKLATKKSEDLTQMKTPKASRNWEAQPGTQYCVAGIDKNGRPIMQIATGEAKHRHSNVGWTWQVPVALTR